MVLQASNRKRLRVSLPVKEERFAAAKVRDSRPFDVCGKSPANTGAVLLELCCPLMARKMLQVGYACFQIPFLCHRMNQVIYHSHVSLVAVYAAFEQTWNLASHCRDFNISFKR